MNFKKLLFTSLFFTICLSLNFSQAKSRPVVDMISATAVSTNKIKITWKIPKTFYSTSATSAASSTAKSSAVTENSTVDSILVYKSTLPISAQTLEKAVLIARLPPKSCQYIDTVTSFREYYYAVLAKLNDGSVYKIILPSINTTVKGVKVEKPAQIEEKSQEQIEAETPKIYNEGIIREFPLPYIDLVENFEKKPNNLKPEVIEAGKKLAEGEKLKKEKLLPYYFDEDLVSPSGGDDYYLFEILKNYFVKKNYKESTSALQKFLSVNRSEQTTNRAAFYLAESQYFLGNYRSALTMFLFVENDYPLLCKKWINSTLDFYQIPGTAK